YPTELLCFFTPFPILQNLQAEEYLYSEYEDIKVKDYRFKLLFNLTENKTLNKHFNNLAVLKIATLDTLSKESHLPLNTSLSELLKGAILNAG
ncbi:MAG: hypothetical protein JSS09_02645, partial [Verrucomicrobia bacterium]|nr:hypothetical protein [Verrucomicrobiota bacterium]